MGSGTAAKIATDAINKMKVGPQIGHAEALRRSITASITKGSGWDHPSIRAPFVLTVNVGQ